MNNWMAIAGGIVSLLAISGAIYSLIQGRVTRINHVQHLTDDFKDHVEEDKRFKETLDMKLDKMHAGIESLQCDVNGINVRCDERHKK